MKRKIWRRRNFPYIQYKAFPTTVFLTQLKTDKNLLIDFLIKIHSQQKTLSQNI